MESPKVYNKAIRDKIPQIIEKDGKKCEFIVLPDAQFLVELEKKLFEEIEEYRGSKSIEELADVLEVVNRISELKGTSIPELEDIRKKKEADRGGFKKNLFLIKTFRD